MTIDKIEQATMGNLHTLWIARRARGIDNIDQVIYRSARSGFRRLVLRQRGGITIKAYHVRQPVW